MMHMNLSSYEGVEDFKSFDPLRFAAYCDSKLRSADHHVAFLRKHFPETPGGWRVCEMGSGNSKLLYSLEQAGLLSHGIGYEISASRHIFAERFKQYVGSTRVINRMANVLDFPPEEAMDFCLGVDVVMCLIGPEAPDAEARTLRWAMNSLRPGGMLVLEFCDWEPRLREIDAHGGVLQTWQQFPPPDPWEFVLENTSRIGVRDILWDKLFLKRGSSERSRMNMVLRSYTKPAAEALLVNEGFTGVEIHDVWAPEAVMNAGEFVVVGKRP
jgi:hypothetical protein